MEYFLKACKAAILLGCYLFPADAAPQSCNCPNYAELRSKYEISEEGSETYISKLQATGNNVCKALAQEWLAEEYLAAGNFDTAEIHLQKAEQIYKALKCNDSLQINLYKIWAQLYYSKADYPNSQEYCFKLLKAAEASGNAYETGNCYTMIAQLFNQTKQADKGVVYTRLAVPFLDQIKNDEKKLELLYKISKRYLWHFQDTKTQSSLDSSEILIRQQLNLALKKNNTDYAGKAFNHLQGIAWEKGDLKTALSLLDSSFKYTPSENYDNLGTNYYDKADIYIELKQYDKARQMADSALRYRKLSSNISYLAELYNLIYAKIGVETGNYKMAYEYKELAKGITDSINNVKKTTEVAELEKKYNQEKNENTIRSLAQQKRIYILLAVAGLFALLGLLFFIRQQSLKNKQKVLETEQRLNRARMNPHFFFNALSSIQSYALEGNDGKSIASNLSKFSHIMRETLESTYKEYVTIEQEMGFLQEYLEIQKIRFPQKFSYEVTTGNNIEADDTLIPSMILQPFAENSIEHGFTGIDYPGHIAISFIKKEYELHISIIDNGKGLATVAKENSEHISRASQIIKDRIYLLNIKLKTKAAFSIENNINGKGVAVLVKLPLLYKQDVKA